MNENLYKALEENHQTEQNEWIAFLVRLLKEQAERHEEACDKIMEEAYEVLCAERRELRDEIEALKDQLKANRTKITA